MCSFFMSKDWVTLSSSHKWPPTSRHRRKGSERHIFPNRYQVTLFWIIVSAGPTQVTSEEKCNLYAKTPTQEDTKEVHSTSSWLQYSSAFCPIVSLWIYLAVFVRECVLTNKLRDMWTWLHELCFEALSSVTYSQLRTNKHFFYCFQTCFIFTLVSCQWMARAPQIQLGPQGI